MPASPRRVQQQGIMVMIMAIMMSMIIPIIGLAIDAGALYVVRGRLSAAVDAAALAAGRSVNLANTVSAATSAAQTTAQQFFSANFPNGYMGTVGTPTVTTTFTQQTDSFGNVNGILDVATSATVQAPTYFMRLLGYSTLPVTSTGTASRRGLVMMLVLDQSSSMNTSPSPSACDVMITAAQSFITYFSPFDYIGMVNFDYTAHLGYAPSTSWGDGSLNTAIGNITCHDNTNTTAALELAYREVRSVGLPLARNTIVMLTDGVPNGVTANFPLRNYSDNRWGPVASTWLGTYPVQSGSSYGFANSCTSGAYCYGMPKGCANVTAQTVYGTVVQWANINPVVQQSISGPYKAFDSDSVSYPAGTCPGFTGAGDGIRQFIAYIPDTDYFGNSTHGVTATGTGIDVVNGLLTRDYWIHQANPYTNNSVNPSTKNIGQVWAGTTSCGDPASPPYYTNCGTLTNFIMAGQPNYGGGTTLRIDQPNTIVAVSMNTAMAEAYRIRADTTYNIVIHTIYLTGNGHDSVDQEFLPVIANVQTIGPLPYQSSSLPLYTNPAFQSHQQVGLYQVTADKNDLVKLFANLASSELRLSH